MSSNPKNDGPPDADSVRQYLKKILASEPFRGQARDGQQKRSARILKFLVDTTLAGRGDSITEYTIGVEALGKDKDFDPLETNIVRVEIGRMRTTLIEYYSSEGSSDEVRIEVIKGTHVPTFVWNTSVGQTDPTPKPPAVQPTSQHSDSYVTIPPLTPYYIHRAEAVESLRNSLIAGEGRQCIALTALRGMGGIGKTVLAQAVCRDEAVQQHFPDGIIWLTIGKELLNDVVARMREVAKVLKDDLNYYDTPQACTNRYRTIIRTKRALIVLDDVWNAHDVAPFLADAPRSRVLLTTRDGSLAAGLDAQEYVANLLTDGEARELLASASKQTSLPPEAADLIRECGCLPLALSMTGAMLRGKPSGYWKQVLNLLRQADLERIRADLPYYPHTDLFRAIQVSVNALDTSERERYLALAVVLEDMPIHSVIQQQLWNVDEFEAASTAEHFVSLSLAQYDGDSLRLHDLQLDYVRSQYHDKRTLTLIHAAVRLSYPVVVRDPFQFASQMIGRFGRRDFPSHAQEFAAALACARRGEWLRPLRASLHPPGTGLVRTLEGHSNGVVARPGTGFLRAIEGHSNGVAVSPDGRTIVSGSDGHTLIWDLETGRELRTLVGHSDGVRTVAVTPDGRTVVSGSDDRTLIIWDLETGRELRTLVGHSDGVRTVAVTPDGRTVVSGSDDRTLIIWDLETGRELRTLVGHSDGVYAVAVSPDGRTIVSGSNDHALKIWDLKSGSELRMLQGPRSHWEGMGGGGAKTILAYDRHLIKFLDIETGQIRTKSRYVNRIWSVMFNSDGRTIVSSDDHTLKIWDLETGRELRTLVGHSDGVRSVAVTSDGKTIVSGSDDHTLKIWDLETGRELRTLVGHSDGVRSVAVTPDGRTVVSASSDHTLKIWDLEVGHGSVLRTEHSAPIWRVAVTPDGRTIVSASNDHALKIWDLETGRELRTLVGHSDGVRSVAVTPDGRTVVSGSDDHTLKIWDLETGRELRTLVGHSFIVSSVAVSPDGRTIVSGSLDGTLQVWNLETGDRLGRLIDHFRDVWCVAVTSDGRTVVSASGDHTLKIWDLETGRELRTLVGHSDEVRSVAVTPDGKTIVSGSDDHTLKIWDLETGRELRTLVGHLNDVTGVAVSPDGKRALSVSNDRTVKLWNLQTGSILGTFTCDAAVGCCEFAASEIAVAGDHLGNIHVLALESARKT